MEQPFEEIREKQKAAWNKFSSGWRKWDTALNNHMQPASAGIISLLKPEGAQLILDIASGTGEPGFSIAAMLTEGKVILTDLSDEMVAIAREKASQKEITNVEFKVCDVCELPFADNSFDGVSCRMGFMFFPDMLLAAKEILRVLKPGGSIAASVWSTADKNSWVTAIGDAISRNIQLPHPSSGTPGIFRCSKPGLLTNIFREAGFVNTFEDEVTCNLNCGTAEIYWEMMTEIAAPVVATLSKTDDAIKEKIKKEVYDLINDKYPEGQVIMVGSCLLIYGQK